MRFVVVMPAYNTARTLAAAVEEIPPSYRHEVLVVDDGSSDGTLAEARRLNLDVIVHPVNMGYGAAQKSGFTAALRRGADGVVLVHADHQYDARAIPELLEPIERGAADVVLGSRRLQADPREQGMPWWRYRGNWFLTGCENRILGLDLTDYHSGLRTYSTRLLKTIRFQDNSDGFLFDQQILVQATAAGFQIAEVAAQCRYNDEVSSIPFGLSVAYGLGTLRTLAQYHRYRRLRRPDSYLAPREVSAQHSHRPHHTCSEPAEASEHRDDPTG